MRKQRGAMYLHKCITRQDQSYNGIVKLVNPNHVRTIELVSSARKRVKNVRCN